MKNKIKVLSFLTIFTIVAHTQVYAQAPNWAWAKGADGDYVNAVTADRSGNIYVVGSFISSITFGSTTLTGTTNGVNMFIVKYDMGGNVLWAKSAEGVAK